MPVSNGARTEPVSLPQTTRGSRVKPVSPSSERSASTVSPASRGTTCTGLSRPGTSSAIGVASSEREPLAMAARADSGVMPPIWMPPTDTVAGTCSEDHTQRPA